MKRIEVLGEWPFDGPGFTPAGFHAAAQGYNPVTGEQFKQCNKPPVEANNQFNKELKLWISGSGGHKLFGPDDPWTKELAKLDVYGRMRNRMGNLARDACNNNREIDFSQKGYKWDDSADDYPWYTPAVDFYNYVTGAGLKSVGSTNATIKILSIDCCCKIVCLEVDVSTELRLGSATRIPQTHISFPDMPTIDFHVPYIGIGGNIVFPLSNRSLSWTWRECLSF